MGLYLCGGLDRKHPYGDGGSGGCRESPGKPCHIELGNGLESNLYAGHGVLNNLELLEGGTRPTLLLHPPQPCLMPCIVLRVVLLFWDTYSSSSSLSSHANWTLFLTLEPLFSCEGDLSKNKSSAGLPIFSNTCINIVGTMSPIIVMVPFFESILTEVTPN